MKKKIIFVLTIVFALVLSIFVFMNNNTTRNTKKENIVLTDANGARKLSQNGSSNYSSSVNEYKIEDTDDLKVFFSLNQLCRGQIFYVTDDIDMTGITVQAKNSFCGTLDGQNHEIFNLSFPSTSYNDDNHYFFNGLDVDGCIKNITFSNISSPARKGTFSTETGCVYFINTLVGELYNVHFKNLQFGGTASWDNYVNRDITNVECYGYGRAAIVGKARGSINHCTVEGSCFLGITAAAALVTETTSGLYCEVSRNEITDSIVMGLGDVGSCMAIATSSLVISNKIVDTLVRTLEEDYFTDSDIKSALTDKFENLEFNVNIGGIVGTTKDSGCGVIPQIIGNYFGDYMGAGSLLQENYDTGDYDEITGILGATRGNVKIGGIIGHIDEGAFPKINLNLFHSSISCAYSDKCHIDSSYTSSFFTCPEIMDDMVSVDNYYLLHIDDDPDNHSAAIRIHTSASEVLSKASDVCGGAIRLTDSRAAAYEGLRPTEGGNCVIPCSQNDGGSIFDEVTPADFKSYKYYCEYDEDGVGMYFRYEDYSNQAITFDLSSLEDFTLNTFLEKGDDGVKGFVYDGGDSYVESDVIRVHRYTLDSENKKYVFDFENAISYYACHSTTCKIAFYDALTVNTTNGNQVDKFALKDSYYLLGQNDTYADSQICMGHEIKFVGVDYACNDIGVDYQPYENGISHILYNGDPQGIFDRMLPITVLKDFMNEDLKATLVDYAPETGSTDYVLESLYPVVTRDYIYDGASATYFNDAATLQAAWDHLEETGFVIRYHFAAATSSANNLKVHFISKEEKAGASADDAEFAIKFYSNENEELANHNIVKDDTDPTYNITLNNHKMKATITYIGAGVYAYNIDYVVQYIDEVGGYNNLFLKFYYKIGTSEYLLDIGSLQTLNGVSQGDLWTGGAQTSFAFITYESDYTLTKTTDTFTYHCFDDGVSVRKYYISEVKYEDNGNGGYNLFEESHENGIPFNPLSEEDKTPGDNLSYAYTVSSHNHTPINYDKKNKTFYFYVDTDLDTAVYGSDYNPTITIEQDYEIYRIYQSFNNTDVALYAYGVDPIYNVDDQFMTPYLYGTEYNSLHLYYKDDGGEYNLPDIYVGEIKTFYTASSEEEIDGLIISAEAYYYNDSNIKTPRSVGSFARVDTSIRKDIYIDYIVASPNDRCPSAQYKYDTRNVDIDIEYIDGDTSYTSENYTNIEFNFSSSSIENKHDGKTVVTYKNGKIYWQLGINNEYLWITDEAYGLNSFVQNSNSDIVKTYHEFEFEYSDTTDGNYKFQAEFIDESGNYRTFLLAPKVFVEDRDRILFDYSHNNDGKKTTIEYNSLTKDDFFKTDFITQTGHISITTVYLEYSINYTWGSNSVSGSLYINDEYVDTINDEFTFEAGVLNYKMSVGDILRFKVPNGSEFDCLVYQMKYQYFDGSEYVDFDAIPTTPVMHSIYVTVGLALESSFNDAYVYNTLNIDYVNIDGDSQDDYSFKYSDSLNNLIESTNGGCNLNGDTLIYYSGDAKSFWLVINNNIKVLLDMPEIYGSSTPFEIYSIDFKLGDGQHVPYSASANGYVSSYSANTDEHTVYVLGGKDITFNFLYDVNDGYEVKSSDDEIEIEDNAYKMLGIKTHDSKEFNLLLTPKWYRVYYFLTYSDYLACSASLDGSEIPGITSRLVQYGDKLPKFPLSSAGQRLAASYIIDGLDREKVTNQTTMDMKNIAIYGEWADAGRLSFDFYFYDTNFQSIDNGEYDLDDVRLYREINGEEVLMDRVDQSQSEIGENEYKLEVERNAGSETMYRYQFVYNADVDASTIKLYVKFLDYDEYKFIDTMEMESGEYMWIKVDATVINEDSTDHSNHLSVIGLGWYRMDDPTIQLELSLDEDYKVSFTNDDLARVLNIYNSSVVRITSLATVIEMNDRSTDIGFTVTRKQYNIYYYMDGDLVHTDSYYSGDSVNMWVPTDDVTLGLRYTDWNEEITVMPKKNVTVFASTIAGTTNTYTVNFSGTITEGMFFIADNKDEITSKTEIIEVIVDGNTITATYKDGKAFLWMLDPITNTSRYLNIDLDSVTEIDLVKYTISDSITNLEVSNLGYHLKNESVSFEVKTSEGYGFNTEETLVGNTIILSKTSDYEINVAPYLKSYNVEYYINDELLHTDTFKYGENITLWAYDYSYNGVFNFKCWSLPESIKTMPASDLLVFGQELASYTLVSMPTISNVHDGEMISTALISGGMITSEGKLLSGTYYFKNPEEIVTKEDSLTKEFDCIFQPDNIYLAPYEFSVTVLVCNPKYKGTLDDIYVTSRTDTSISLHINNKYEFYLDNGIYEVGRDLVLTGLKENTIYTITYRYKEDDNYCASDLMFYRIKTLSKDELLYENSQKYGLELIESLVNYIDNKTIQRYLSLFQTKLSLDYDEEMNGVEAKAYVEYLSQVFDLFLDIEAARIPLSRLDARRINDYANKTLEEIAALAFAGDESAKDLANYSNYVCNAFNKADDILNFFKVSMQELIDSNSSSDIVVLSALNNTNKVSALEKNEFVITRVDELFNYNYSNYSHVNLDEYKDSYIGNTVNLMTNLNNSLHNTDGEVVVNAINLCVSRVQAKTYEDYTFNREEYDKLFFIAAEAAVVAHMQMVVLSNLEVSYNFKVELIKEVSKAILLKQVYVELVVKYSDFDTFYNEYKNMIENGNDMTYQDCVEQFGKNLDSLLVVPVNSGLTGTEIVILYVFISSIVIVIAVVLIKFFVKRRMTYAARQREQ